MGLKFNYKDATFDFIDYESPGIIGHIQKGKLERVALYETSTIVGNIYRGSVVKWVDHLECAFVDIGLDSNAYLPKKFIRKHWDGRDIKQGDTIFVEVKKAAVGDKGPVVTMDYSLKEEDLVYLPNSKGVRLSNKLLDRGERQRLLNWGKGKGLPGGIILRTSSVYKEVSHLDLQLERLVLVEESLIRERNFLPTPRLIYSRSPLENFLLDRRENPLIVNHKSIYKKLLQLNTAGLMLDEDFSIRSEVHFRKQFDRIFGNVVHLKNGANIVIDRTEALTVIDINTAHAKMEGSFEEYVYATNVSAAEEIARQIKLRNISGMVIIDFIRNEEEAKRNKIKSVLENAFHDDRVKTKVFGFTHMGVFELSRQRTRPLFITEYREAMEQHKLRLVEMIKE